MKIFIFITLFFILVSGQVFAQEETLPDNSSDSTNTELLSNNKLKPVVSVIRAWTLEKQNSTINLISVDTATIDFHNYTPIFQKSISNTYLGYLGAPYISNNFFDRINNHDYYFLTSLEAYRHTQRDVAYYFTSTPFSLLKYVQGTEEQMFNAFFTQNIDTFTNVGFRYDILKNNGQYKNQESNHKNLNFFFSRNSKRYNGYASITTETNKVFENGGISDSFINLSRNPNELLVNLNQAIGPTIKTFSIFTSHEYLLGRNPFLVERDTLEDTTFLPRYGIQYSIELNNYKRDFLETEVKNNYFDTVFLSADANSTVSSSFQRITQILQIKAFENNNRKFTFGKRVFLENEIVRAVHPISSGKEKYEYSNLFLGGEISNATSSFMQWSALARFALLGRNIGDALVKGTINKPFNINNNELLLSIEGWYQNISPDIFQENWYDNHFMWKNNFDKQHEVVLKASVNWDKLMLHMGVNYAMFSNFLYNDYNSKPSQFTGQFSVINYWLNKRFTLGPLGWNNKVIIQQATNNTVLHLPTLNYYSSIYFSGLLFKVMKYQIGAEMYYNSKFYADKYEPSTSRFYLQDKIITGGYPQLNAFVNVKLKRTSAFAQLMHLNSSFSNGNFFSSPSYPINQMAFRFGFLWSFYD